MSQTTDKKRILYLITQSEFGGAQRYVFDLANNLKGEFDVAVAFGRQGDNSALAKNLIEAGIKFYTLPRLKRSISPVNDFAALLEIIKLIKKLRPDIIHLNSSKISILGSLATLFTKSKIIYTVHGWVFNEPRPRFTKWFYKWTEKFSSRLKHKIICVSEYDRRVALKYKIAAPNKLITIHNGMAPLNFYSKELAGQILRSQIPESKFSISYPLIGLIGNLYKTKGFENFIKAAHILINDFKLQFRCLIIGEGDERKSLENLIEKYNLKNNFILAGRIDEAAKLLPALDIYVCSSVKEGLPYSILEAMQAGLPIVSTNVGGIPEMIENGKNGLLIPPKNSAELADKIKLLLHDKRLCHKIGEQAKISVLNNFNLEKMITQTKKIYQD